MASFPPHSFLSRVLLRRSSLHLPPIISTARIRLVRKASRSFSLNNKHDDDGNRVVVPAIIAGGGPTGLFLSALLSAHSIPHLVLDGRSVEELTRHPQAHFINLRSMEILRSELSENGNDFRNRVGVYEEILREMPPVKEWEAFHFGGCVSGDGGRRLGRVIHPVGQALRVGQRGDAVLVTAKSEDGTIFKHESSAERASPCQPAHLAQNKFVSLLLEKAKRISNGSHLHYNEEIVNISQEKPFIQDYNNSDNKPIISIHTSKNQTYHTRYLLACDGVHSFARKHFNIPMKGEPALQHMINVHFRTNGPLSELLMHRQSAQTADNSQNDGNQDSAMLHFVYNPHLMGAFVCHDGRAGEWVLQIPYFPPYQSVEEDFSKELVTNMIWFGLLGRSPTENEHWYDIDILSLRSWTMSSQVAERYVNDSHNVALVGDAAHAFPPAGGLGMNTGLQDAHNLAWRLALVLHREKKVCNKRLNVHSTDPTAVSPSSDSIINMYERDRRPIATQNAALSVRNYQRTLRIARACYLDAQHPQLLMAMLGAPPMSFLPLQARKDIFRRLVRIAMMPLGSLLSKSNSVNHSFHANRVERNVRSILESGGSLPLVFPSYELGFSYNSSVSDGQSKVLDDSAEYYPRIRVGHRFPHIEVEVLTPHSFGKVGWSVLETPHRLSTHMNESTSLRISLVDISSQLRQVHSLSIPLFTILVLGSDLIKSSAVLQRVATGVMNKWDVPLILANVHREKSDGCVDESTSAMDSHTQEDSYNECKVEHFVDIHQALYELSHSELSTLSESNHSQRSRNTSHEEMNALIMIRPDGHVANVSCIDLFNPSAELATQVCTFIENGFRNSLGEIYEPSLTASKR
ncbi:hypothetical protein ACHAW6_008418 [Cyclotella cf. meneghiniana]